MNVSLPKLKRRPSMMMVAALFILAIPGCQKTGGLVGKWQLMQAGKVVDIETLASPGLPPVIREFDPDGSEKVSASFFRQDPLGRMQPAGWGMTERAYRDQGSTLIETSKGVNESNVELPGGDKAIVVPLTGAPKSGRGGDGKDIVESSTSTFTLSGDNLTITQTSATGKDFSESKGAQIYSRQEESNYNAWWWLSLPGGIALLALVARTVWKRRRAVPGE